MSTHGEEEQCSMIMKTIESQTGKHEKPDPWKRQKAGGKKKTRQKKKKHFHFLLIPVHCDFDNMQ